MIGRLIDPRRRQKLWQLLLILILVLTPTLMRVRLLSTAYSHPPLDPDAITYRDLAREILIKGTYVNEKVPFFPVVIALFFYLFGPTDLTQRFISFAIGILAIVVTYWLARREFGYETGVLASFLLATNYYVVFNSFRGLREELSSLLLLCLVYFAVVRRNNGALRVAVVSILTAMLYFTRSDTALIVALTLLAYIICSSILKKQKMPVATICFMSLILVVSIAGWCLYSAMMFGDAFAESTNYASWMYWVEIDKLVSAWYPMKVSMIEYLFGFHSPTQLIISSAKGTLWILRFLDFFKGKLPIVVILLFSSAVTIWMEKRNWYYLLLLGIALPYLGMFHHLGVIETPRFLVSFEPVFFILISYPLVRAYRFIVSETEALSRMQSLILFGSMAYLMMGYVYVNYVSILALCGYLSNQATTTLSLTLVDVILLTCLLSLCLLWFVLVIYENKPMGTHAPSTRSVVDEMSEQRVRYR